MNTDIIILGSGPAGLAAAVAARGRNKSVLVIGNDAANSPLAKAERIDNYLGLPAHSGAELLALFRRHAESAGAQFIPGRVISLLPFDGYALTVGSEVYQCKALILAPGVVRQTKFPGEAEYLGRGVSYCATCDGMLYRGRRVAVFGQSADAPEEAAFLREIGCDVTYIAPKRPDSLEADIPFVQANKLEVRGEGTVTAVLAGDAEIPCACAFILRPALSPTDLLPQLAVENGFIAVDRTMATNQPGVFAAGDCTGTPFQIAKAVGEGHIAGLSAAAYLDRAE
jgi:thioredoxin reductase (NADPH)